MGLDGISPNQIRQLSEVNSAELNSILKPNNNLNTRVVDGLSKDQRVDPDKENKNHNFNNNSNNEANENENEQETEENEKFEDYKIDLSQTNKYDLKLNENSNTIVIVEKSTQKTVQVINADNLAIFVKNLVEGKGAIVNRKF